MKSKLHRIAFLLFITVLLLGCTPPDVAINEIGAEEKSYEETIHINNCGGKDASEQTSSRSLTTSFDAEVGVKASKEVIEGSLAAKYGQSRNTTKSQKVSAPAGTNMEIVLRWFEDTRSGNVVVNGQSSPYTVRIPVSVEQVSSRDIGCAGTNKKVCEVMDIGGVNDKSFNATAWKGLEEARTKLNVESKYLESRQPSDYEKNINAFIAEKCDLITTIGFLLGDATKAAAEKNPNQNFAVIDYTYTPPIQNILGITFQTDQAAFLAGYLAAGISKTGKVATFGGMQIPTVTVFMDGYYYGVQYYNRQNSTNVQVIGWNPSTQNGLFVGNFESNDDGKKIGQTLLDQGADVIFPVAGKLGLGTAEIAKTRGSAWIIGVDNDWAMTNPEFKEIVLTSVLKRSDAAVFDASKAVVDGSFKGGRIYNGTLANNGVGLGTVASVVSSDLLQRVEKIKADIIAGKIPVNQ